MSALTDKTYAQLTAATTAADTDLVAVFITADGLLKKMTFATFKTAVASSLSGTFLAAPSNLSDLPSAAAARANLGLGTAALLASTGVFQVSNNLSEVLSASTARTNIGAAASDAPTITSGMTYSGATKQNVQAVASTSIDASTAEAFTKSISSNTTFTFTGATASKAQGFMLELTVSSSAIPTWPASVTWDGGVIPEFSNGVHMIGFVTMNGGTTWRAAVFGSNFA